MVVASSGVGCWGISGGGGGMGSSSVIGGGSSGDFERGSGITVRCGGGGDGV